jgi:hypothetical protein
VGRWWRDSDFSEQMALGGAGLDRPVALGDLLRRQELMEASHRFTKACLLASGAEPARALLGTGLSEEHAKALELGLHPGPSVMEAHLRSLGFSRWEMGSLTLIEDRWTGDLIVPWRNPRGRLVALCGWNCLGDPLAVRVEFAGQPPERLIAWGLDVALRYPPNTLVLVQSIVDALLVQARGYLSVAAVPLITGGVSQRRLEAFTALSVREVTLVPSRDERGERWVHDALAAGRRVSTPALYVADPVHMGTRTLGEAVRSVGLSSLLDALSKRLEADLYAFTNL